MPRQHSISRGQQSLSSLRARGAWSGPGYPCHSVVSAPVWTLNCCKAGVVGKKICSIGAPLVWNSPSFDCRSAQLACSFRRSMLKTELLRFGLHLVSGWLVVVHTYLYYFPLSLSRCLISNGADNNLQACVSLQLCNATTLHTSNMAAVAVV